MSAFRVESADETRGVMLTRRQRSGQGSLFDTEGSTDTQPGLVQATVFRGWSLV